MAAKLAKSKSGHDRGHYYVIVKEEEECVYVADGILKKLERPKKKNRKHIQIIKSIPDEVEELLSEDKVVRDLEIKRALKTYMKKNEKIVDNIDGYYH